MPPRQFEVEEIPVPRASLPHYFPHYLLVTPSADSRHHSILSLSRPLNARTLPFRPVNRPGPSRTPLDCLRDWFVLICRLLETNQLVWRHGRGWECRASLCQSEQHRIA
jgi:hypothetical protein